MVVMFVPFTAYLISILYAVIDDPIATVFLGFGAVATIFIFWVIAVIQYYIGEDIGNVSVQPHASGNASATVEVKNLAEAPSNESKQPSEERESD